MGEWYSTFFQRLGNPRKVNSAVDWFKRCQFILFDSITSHWKWNVTRGRFSFHLVEKLETLLQPCVLNLKNTCPMIYQQMNSSIWKPTQYENNLVLHNISTNASCKDEQNSHAQWACNIKIFNTTYSRHLFGKCFSKSIESSSMFISRSQHWIEFRALAW